MSLFSFECLVYCTLSIRFLKQKSNDCSDCWWISQSNKQVSIIKQNRGYKDTNAFITLVVVICLTGSQSRLRLSEKSWLTLSDSPIWRQSMSLHVQMAEIEIYKKSKTSYIDTYIHYITLFHHHFTWISRNNNANQVVFAVHCWHLGLRAKDEYEVRKLPSVY